MQTRTACGSASLLGWERRGCQCGLSHPGDTGAFEGLRTQSQSTTSPRRTTRSVWRFWTRRHLSSTYRWVGLVVMVVARRIRAFRNGAPFGVRCALRVGRLSRMPAAEHARGDPLFQFLDFECQSLFHLISPPFRLGVWWAHPDRLAPAPRSSLSVLITQVTRAVRNGA